MRIYYVRTIVGTLVRFEVRPCYCNGKLFCGFPGYKSVQPEWFKICVGFITGTPKGSPIVVFMEKPGIEPATPGLQDIGLSPTPRRLLKTAQDLTVSVVV